MFDFVASGMRGVHRYYGKVSQHYAMQTGSLFHATLPYLIMEHLEPTKDRVGYLSVHLVVPSLGARPTGSDTFKVTRSILVLVSWSWVISHGYL